MTGLTESIRGQTFMTRGGAHVNIGVMPEINNGIICQGGGATVNFQPTINLTIIIKGNVSEEEKQGIVGMLEGLLSRVLMNKKKKAKGEIEVGESIPIVPVLREGNKLSSTHGC